MKFDPEILKQAVGQGGKEVVKAFEKLTDASVEVDVGEVSLLSLDDVAKRFEDQEHKAIIAFAQIVTGLEGASVLMMSREDALVFVDLISSEEVGSTGVLKDFDRSVIKESLNILSNAYLNALAEGFKKQIMIGPPHMVTNNRLKDMTPGFVAKSTDGIDAAVFESALKVSGHKIEAVLYLIFNPDIVSEIDKLNHVS